MINWFFLMGFKEQKILDLRYMFEFFFFQLNSQFWLFIKQVKMFHHPFIKTLHNQLIREPGKHLYVD